MSYDDKRFLEQGYRVRHKYKRGRGNTRTCELCGCKRRRVSSGWEYLNAPGTLGWTMSNPPCALKEAK